MTVDDLLRLDSHKVGLAASGALHLLVLAYIAISFRNPLPLAPPVDLAGAVPISMTNFLPTPPPPQPKPRPKAPDEVVTSTSTEATVQAAEKSEPDSAPAEPEQTSSSASGPASYASLVAGILQRNKRYPRLALQAGIEGDVSVYFVVNRQGHVIGYRIDQPSGQYQLDNEAVALLKRVSFPPIPDDGGDPERREFTVPLAFRVVE